jgi:hypothetical protein
MCNTSKNAKFMDIMDRSSVSHYALSMCTPVVVFLEPLRMVDFMDLK